jgi:hypothetical protein
LPDRFIRKVKLSDAPESFEDIVAAIKVFLEPLVASLAEGWHTPPIKNGLIAFHQSDSLGT